LIEFQSGQVRYIVVATSGAGGTNETLRAVPRAKITFRSDDLTIALAAAEFEGLKVLEAGA
jgi:hypothetical protein